MGRTDKLRRASFGIELHWTENHDPKFLQSFCSQINSIELETVCDRDAVQCGDRFRIHVYRKLHNPKQAAFVRKFRLTQSPQWSRNKDPHFLGPLCSRIAEIQSIPDPDPISNTCDYLFLVKVRKCEKSTRLTLHSELSSIGKLIKKNSSGTSQVRKDHVCVRLLPLVLVLAVFPLLLWLYLQKNLRQIEGSGGVQTPELNREHVLQFWSIRPTRYKPLVSVPINLLRLETWSRALLVEVKCGVLSPLFEVGGAWAKLIPTSLMHWSRHPGSVGTLLDVEDVHFSRLQAFWGATQRRSRG
ncbi:hypothetical protein MMC10_007603 [Thelotrema lepadinum]|nr:hypothetical protein [Thelotrema lepadinum]